MKRKISFSIGRLQFLYGDERALEIAKEIGADAVDFNLCGKAWEYQNPDSIYSKSDEEIVEYYTNTLSQLYNASSGLGDKNNKGNIAVLIFKLNRLLEYQSYSEPYKKFFDFMIIGDGETVFRQVLDILKKGLSKKSRI